MTDQSDPRVVPGMMAELEWVWVLTSALTKNQDSIFVVDMEDRADGARRRIVPVFETREDAARLQPQITQGREREYTPHAMRLNEVGLFAAKNNLEIMLLDRLGNIMAHMEAKLEQASVH